MTMFLICWLKPLLSLEIWLLKTIFLSIIYVKLLIILVIWRISVWTSRRYYLKRCYVTLWSFVSQKHFFWDWTARCRTPWSFYVSLHSHWFWSTSRHRMVIGATCQRVIWKYKFILIQVVKIFITNERSKICSGCRGWIHLFTHPIFLGKKSSPTPRNKTSLSALYFISLVLWSLSL